MTEAMTGSETLNTKSIFLRQTFSYFTALWLFQPIDGTNGSLWYSNIHPSILKYVLVSLPIHLPSFSSEYTYSCHLITSWLKWNPWKPVKLNHFQVSIIKFILHPNLCHEHYNIPVCYKSLKLVSIPGLGRSGLKVILIQINSSINLR